MAVEQITQEYKLGLDGFKAQINELEKGFTNISKKGKDSQEVLEKAIKKTAATSKQSTDEYLEAARKRKQALDIEINNLKQLEDRKKKAFNVADINTLNAAIGETNNRIKALGGEIEKTGKSTSNFAGNLKGIGAAVGIAFGVGAIVNFAKEAIILSAKAEGIRTAFARIGGEADLEKLRKATRGATSDLELMQAALRGKNFGISTDLLAKGLELAGKVARTTGQDVTYLTDSFVDGLGRKSIRILDNLQISQVALQKEIKRTGDFNTAVSNIVTQKLKEIGDVSDTTADRFARFSAGFKNFSVTVGDFFINTAAGIIGFFENFKPGSDVLNAFAAIFGLDEKSRKGVQVTAQREASLKAQGEAAKSAKVEFEAYLASLRKSEGSTFDLIHATESFIKTREEQISKLNPKADKDRISLIRAEIDAINDSSKASGAAVGSIEALKQAIEDKKEELQGANIANGDSLKISKEIYVLEQKLKAALGEETDAQKSLKKSIEETRKEREKDLEQFRKTQEEETKKNQGDLDNSESAKLKEEIKLNKEVREAREEINKEHEKNRAQLNKSDERDAEIKIKRQDAIKKGAIEAAQITSDTTFTILEDSAKREEELQLAQLQAQEQAELDSIDRREQKALDQKNLTEAQRKNIEEKFNKEREKTQQAFAAKELAIKKKAFEDNKKLAIAQALINGALAITRIIADVPKADFGIATAILIGLATLQSAAQIAVISAQKFAKGTPYLQRGSSPVGVDTIPIYANEGEAIIPTDKNKKYPGLADAWISGRLDDFIHQNNVMPALREAVAKSKDSESNNMAKAMAASIMLNNNTKLDEYTMARAMKKALNGTTVNVGNIKDLGNNDNWLKERYRA